MDGHDDGLVLINRQVSKCLYQVESTAAVQTRRWLLPARRQKSESSYLNKGLTKVKATNDVGIDKCV